LYALILLIYITLSPYLGQDGPIYPRDGIETSACRRTWWRNLLYINNLFDSGDGCMPVKDKISIWVIPWRSYHHIQKYLQIASNFHRL
jgi:hypothetical protein